MHKTSSIVTKSFRFFKKKKQQQKNDFLNNIFYHIYFTNLLTSTITKIQIAIHVHSTRKKIFSSTNYVFIFLKKESLKATNY